ncbi:site-2 protease family protein [Chondromyces apiculatus]|uniref:Peptidase M50 domain-containing protein n=1 Tax=Chondromyces apiculatus DSM 436 TaxID=1192034 RepID=A0A017SY83_9BACT|nr:site-2 protease family protein [Chondromyces apiculatus]EYF01535.1 Hypothetical protein CAP_8096 [Chondromyces apiculatus DSM 436]
MLSFRFFGIPVGVQPWFWITAVILNMNLLTRGGHSGPFQIGLMLVWVGVVFVSVLVHELGHAFAIRRYRIEPEIMLHGLGGATTWRAVLPLRRRDHIFISLAGPFAGFIFGGLIFLAQYFIPGTWNVPALAVFALDCLLWVNIAWGVFNLIPVLPFDGGHVLEHALGPKRVRLTAGISFLVAGSLTLLSVVNNQYWIAFLFGMSAFSSYQRFRAEPEVTPADLERPRPVVREEPVPGDLLALLRRARRAVEEERLDEAAALAAEVLAQEGVPRPAAREAHEVMAWVRLLGYDPRGASTALAQAKRLGDPDPALTGAILLALGDTRQARRVLEDARVAGDERKEVVGPLIQILIAQGEVQKAAAHALDIVEALSEEDARQMAQIAFDHGAFEWSARLYEAVFRRNGAGEDAYGAARASARDGNVEHALDLLRQAVEAGFSDHARAWSDSALESLRNGPLETVVPRP